MLKERDDRNVEERWRKVGNIKRGWVTDARREGECKPYIEYRPPCIDSEYAEK